MKDRPELMTDSKLELVSMTSQYIKEIWHKGHAADFWPLLDLSFPVFQKWVNVANSSPWMGETQGIRAIQVGQTCIGFIVKYSVPPEYIPEFLSECVEECGTYLLPEFRGQGLSVLIKAQMIEEIRREKKASIHTFVFVVATTNLFALKAMSKLPWPMEVIASEGQISAHPLKRFARWRAYQEGVPVQVWALTFDDIHRG